MKDNIIVKTSGLKKYFNSKGRNLKAVDNINLEIFEGETFGLVGESGCGKTTLGRTILKLYPITDGKIYFNNKDITDIKEKNMKPYRKEMQMIFQDPYASLDPRMMVWEIVAEGIMEHFKVTKAEAEEKAEHFIKLVGLLPEQMTRYPHEFSGGQRQRIGIARALALNPKFIVCDEPISALDVSVQAQIVNMLKDIQGQMGLTYLFIAHDISMVKYISDRIGVMYLGQMVESGPANEVFNNPMHPYTKALCSAVPIPDPDISAQNKRIILQGDVPSPFNVPEGCRFAGRCAHATKECLEALPELKSVGDKRFVACYHI